MASIAEREEFEIQTSHCPFEFFCFSEENVKKYTGKSDPVDVMGALRQDKDKFKPKHWLGLDLKYFVKVQCWRNNRDEWFVQTLAVLANYWNL